MNLAIPSSVKALGLWSAVIATLLSLFFDVSQLGEWLGLMGSGGGPENSSTPLGLVVLLTPSLLLAPAFLVLMVSIDLITPSDRKVWSHVAVAFATVYTVLVSMNYFVQLTWIAPRLVERRTAGIEPFLFKPFDSFLYAVDLLGYSFMSLATLFAACVFPESGLERKIRWFLTANGFLIPFIALQNFYHPLIWFASLWAVTFPGSTWALAIFFHRARVTSADR